MSKTDNTEVILSAMISPYHLPRPIDWEGQFGRTGPVQVEIGSGLGEFLVSQAAMSPGANLVGIELDWQRVKKTLARIERLRRTGRDGAGANIRLLQIDATVALQRLFRPRSIDRIFCLFPCPWPKRNHSKHRLFSRRFCRLANSRLISGGQVKIVTDYAPYFEWLREETRGTGFQIECREIRPQFDTKFERKWIAEGQEQFYEMLLTKRQHADIPLEEDRAVQVYFCDNFQPERLFFPEVVGDPAVVQKDFLFDAAARKGMLHLVVAERDIVQHLWVLVAACQRGWCIAKAEGQTVLPTKGIALALRLAADAVRRTAEDSWS